MQYPTDRIAHTMTFVTVAGMINSSMAPPGGIVPTPVTAEAETLTLCSAL